MKRLTGKRNALPVDLWHFHQLIMTDIRETHHCSELAVELDAAGMIMVRGVLSVRLPVQTWLAAFYLLKISSTYAHFDAWKNGPMLRWEKLKLLINTSKLDWSYLNEQAKRLHLNHESTATPLNLQTSTRCSFPLGLDKGKYDALGIVSNDSVHTSACNPM